MVEKNKKASLDDREFGRTVTARSKKQDQAEIKRVLKLAKKKYGIKEYNRLDPASYTPEYSKKIERNARQRRVGIAIAGIVIIVSVAVVIVTIVWRMRNPKLVYEVNVCSENDVAKMVGAYHDGDIENLNEYAAEITAKDGSASDGKCAYIVAMANAINGNSSGVRNQQAAINNTTDQKNVGELIERNNYPTINELSNSEGVVVSNDATAKYDEAISNATTDDEKASAYREKLFFYESNGNVAGGRKVVSDMLEALPNSIEAYRIAGDYFYSGAVNDSALAIEYYEKVIQLMQLSSDVDYTSEIDYYQGLVSGLKGES